MVYRLRRELPIFLRSRTLPGVSSNCVRIMFSLVLSLPSTTTSATTDCPVLRDVESHIDFACVLVAIEHHANVDIVVTLVPVNLPHALYGVLFQHRLVRFATGTGAASANRASFTTAFPSNATFRMTYCGPSSTGNTTRPVPVYAFNSYFGAFTSASRYPNS